MQNPKCSHRAPPPRPKPSRETTSVHVNRRLSRMAKAIASWRGITLRQYLDGCLDHCIEADAAETAREMLKLKSPDRESPDDPE